MSTRRRALRSGLYRGTVVHSRHHDPSHHFRYSIMMPLVFLDELDELMGRHRLWSSRRPTPIWFREADFLVGPGRSRGARGTLEGAVRDTVEQHLGWRPTGRVAMLAHLRTWGWLFNPITLYYCFGHDGRDLDAIVVEVTNTPWKERHVYVLEGAAGEHRFSKAMHVSPFMGMDLDYVMSASVPGETVSVRLGSRRGDVRVFDANLELRRVEPTRRELGRLVWRRPLQAYGVTAGIYRQAASLARRGAPFHPHPSAPSCPRGGQSADRTVRAHADSSHG